MLKNIKKVNRRIFLVCFLIVIFITYLASLAWQIGNFSNTQNPIYRQNADFIIVLGAGVWDNLPTPVFEARLKHSLELAQKFENLKIVCTGGLGAGDSLSEAEICQNYLISGGISKNRILLEKNPSKTTYQNLIEAKKFINHSERTLIVSDPLHLFRATEMCKKIGIQAYPEPTPYTLYQSFETQLVFILRELWFWHVFIFIGI